MFSTGEVLAMEKALIRLALHEPDWRYVRGHCLRLLEHADPCARQSALICLGHLARLHRPLELKQLVPLVRRHRLDPSVAGWAQDTLDDFKIFLGI
jgi:hypothetical protein